MTITKKEIKNIKQAIIKKVLSKCRDVGEDIIIEYFNNYVIDPIEYSLHLDEPDEYTIIKCLEFYRAFVGLRDMSENEKLFINSMITVRSNIDLEGI